MSIGVSSMMRKGMTYEDAQEEYEKEWRNWQNRPLWKKLNAGQRVITSGGYLAIILESSKNGIEYAYQSPEDCHLDGVNDETFKKRYYWSTQNVDKDGISKVYDYASGDLNLTERQW